MPTDMTKPKVFTPAFPLPLIIITILLFATTGCSNKTNGPADDKPGAVTETSDTTETIWHVKAFLPDGHILNVKALDKSGNIYDVKAIQKGNNFHMMDIKALVGEKKLPVKMLVSNDKYTPVKAIGEDGYGLRYQSTDSRRRSPGCKRNQPYGKCYSAKSDHKNGDFYGIKALSAKGQLYDVKGIKLSSDSVEATVNGVAVYAHIKALPQIGEDNTDSIWHVKAIQPDGKILDIKALDKNGNINDVKAIVKDGDLHMMDIKAFIGGKKLPVKIAGKR
ncbi:MAG: hypothetical protein WDN26_02320 [Chitinophagaceae bacterium]